jgi:hypothetical protein
MPGRIVRRATYIHEYHALTQKDGVPFVPDAVAKDLLFSAFILLSIAACALCFGPFGPSGQPDPTIIRAVPRPDYFFLWLRGSVIAFAITRNSGVADRTGHHSWRSFDASVFLRGRREELEAPADRGSNDPTGSRWC